MLRGRQRRWITRRKPWIGRFGRWRQCGESCRFSPLSAIAEALLESGWRFSPACRESFKERWGFTCCLPPYSRGVAKGLLRRVSHIPSTFKEYIFPEMAWVYWLREGICHLPGDAVTETLFAFFFLSRLILFFFSFQVSIQNSCWGIRRDGMS